MDMTNIWQQVMKCMGIESPQYEIAKFAIRVVVHGGTHLQFGPTHPQCSISAGHRMGTSKTFKQTSFER